MIAILITVAIALFSSFIGLLTWVVVAFVKHTSNTKLHQSTSERDAIIDGVKQQIDAHGKLDDERFSKIEKKLDEMSADLKTLLSRRTRSRR